MNQIGVGDTHNDFLFVNSCFETEGFNSLIEVDTRYQLEEPRIAHYTQLLNEQADTTRRGWRYRIARWMLQVADEFCLKRDTALIALNLFDRNMSTSLHKVDRDEFQLSAITCLFLSSKLYQKRPLKLSTLLRYTNNAFQKECILSMEEKMLQTNESFFYPPTSSTFVSLLLNGLSNTTEPAAIAKVIESCQFMIELAACDFFFVAHRASTIAVAVIVVTLETQTQSSKSSIQVNLSPEAISSCLSNMKAKIDFTEDASVKAAIEKLRSIYPHNEQRIQDLEQEKATDEEVATYTAKGTETNVACRVATPSPTDACQQCSASSPPKLLGEDDGDQTSRKRRRRSIEIEIV